MANQSLAEPNPLSLDPCLGIEGMYIDVSEPLVHFMLIFQYGFCP